MTSPRWEPNTETEGSEDNLGFLDGGQGRDRADGFAHTQRQRGPKETVGLKWGYCSEGEMLSG